MRVTGTHPSLCPCSRLSSGALAPSEAPGAEAGSEPTEQTPRLHGARARDQEGGLRPSGLESSALDRGSRSSAGGGDSCMSQEGAVRKRKTEPGRAGPACAPHTHRDSLILLP